MTRLIYDPTSFCWLPASTEASVSEGAWSAVKSPKTGKWFAYNAWTGSSCLVEHVPAEDRAPLDEVLAQEHVSDKLLEASAADWYQDLPPRRAAGGVVIDQNSRILLRAPAKAFGGYVWTWPKGGLDPGESHRDAALREVQEEVGWSAKIVERVGEYRGDTTITRIYLMRPVARVGDPDAETERIAWVRPERAVQLLSKTINRRGQLRDLTILRDALDLHDRLFGTLLLDRVVWRISAKLSDARDPVRVVLPEALSR